MQFPSYGAVIWLKHEKIETNFQLGVKGLTDVFMGHVGMGSK